MATNDFAESEKPSKFFAASPWWSFSFLLNAACGVVLLFLDIWMIIRRWKSFSQDTITFLAFWVGLIAIVGPFISYVRTYSELHVHCQGATDLQAPHARNLANAIYVAENALDTQMLQYYAVVFTVILCLTKVFAH